ncbi:MAG: glutathione S-transferase N-terminal domain-containing protein [Acidobacteriota bacterium]
MSDWTLLLGNRNYSSWSLRAWLAVRQAGVDVREEMVFFDGDQDRAQWLTHGPTGKVPLLKHGERVIWDSLAIGEYPVS